MPRRAAPPWTGPSLMNRIPFHKSVSGRLLFLGLAPAVLALAAIVGLAALDSYSQLRRAEERTMLAQAAGTAGEYSMRNERWNNVATVIALAQQNGMLGERRSTLDFLRATVETLPPTAGMFVIYEADVDGNDAESLQSTALPRAAMDATGRFLPYWFHDPSAGGQIALKANTGMDVEEYYQGPKAELARTGKPTAVVTEPYVYEGVALISHVVPIVWKGRFGGVAGVDRALDTLGDIVAEAKTRSGADVFVISKGGRIIAATAMAADGTAAGLSGKSVSATAFASLLPMWIEARDRLAVVDADDPVLNERCYYAVKVAPVGDWTVVLRRPRAEVLHDAHLSLGRNIALGLVGLLFVATFLGLLARTLRRRIGAAVETADRIAQGDLAHQVVGSVGSDEAGQLVVAMQAMSRNLNGLVSAVKQSSIQLNSTATEMSATARQQEASASSFGAASSQIAAAVKEISATGKDLSRTMDGVSGAAVETAALATSGRAGLQGMEGVMNDLDRATGSVAEKLATINERSQKITTVVTTITKVADQTNILSINAAIEAEKAGEYGSGFLVIAREIRRLADTTAAATLDIEQSVRQMQAAVSAGVMEMDRFADQVRRGVRDVVSVGSKLSEIIERVNGSTESFRSVSDSMQSQAEGANQISDAMVQLTGNATQTMQSISEFGRAAEDLQASIATLRQAVSQFRLKE